MTWRFQLQVIEYYYDEYSLSLIFLKVFQKMLYCLCKQYSMPYDEFY